MSSVTGYFNDAAAVGQAGYGLANQITRALHGNREKVHFVQGNVTVVEFDVTLNEGHSFTVAPTTFPVEGGQAIADHATVAPITLSLTGVVSDYPVETKNQLINSTVTSAGVALSTPFGALGVLGSTIGFSALGAQRTSQSRSAKVFDDLQRLAGFANEQREKDGKTPEAKAKTEPQTFDVWTRLRVYPNMMITQLQLNRDSTSGPSNMVFTVGLQQVRVAYSRTIFLNTVVPDKATPLQKLGAGEEKKSRLEVGVDEGSATAKQQQTGIKQAILNILPGTPP